MCFKASKIFRLLSVLLQSKSLAFEFVLLFPFSILKGLTSVFLSTQVPWVVGLPS